MISIFGDGNFIRRGGCDAMHPLLSKLVAQVAAKVSAVVELGFL
jgi:hypothetical protein